MSSMYLWMILLLPLSASVVIATVGRKLFPDKCHLPCIAGAWFLLEWFVATRAGRGIVPGWWRGALGGRSGLTALRGALAGTEGRHLRVILSKQSSILADFAGNFLVVADDWFTMPGSIRIG